MELRHTTNDKQVCEFTLAVKRDKDTADFINCVVWNNQAENLCKYQNKGSLIAVLGELRTETYEVNEEKRYKTYVLANNVEFLENKKSDNSNQAELKEENPFEQFAERVEVQESFEYSESDFPF